MNIKEQKISVRNRILQKRNSYSMEWVSEQSRIIQNFLLESREYQEAETIFCYVSYGKEVATMPVIEDALWRGKNVGVPLCTGKGIMEVCKIHDLSELHPGAYGILEPAVTSERIEKQEIQYAIIPCVTCDRKGNRMGHGAGYYDRYLSDADCIKVILCFEELLAKEVPTDDHDVRMDYLVSQAGMKKIME